MSHYALWEFIKCAYFVGAGVSLLITFWLSRDNALSMRLLAAVLIALTWPLSFPVVLLFSLL